LGSNPMKIGLFMTTSSTPYKFYEYTRLPKLRINTVNESRTSLSENTKIKHAECPYPLGPGNGFLGITTR